MFCLFSFCGCVCVKGEASDSFVVPSVRRGLHMYMHICELKKTGQPVRHPQTTKNNMVRTWRSVSLSMGVARQKTAPRRSSLRMFMCKLSVCV